MHACTHARMHAHTHARTCKARMLHAVVCCARCAGSSMLPHSCIGSARRLMVSSRHRLHEYMLEAVQNHTPDVIIVDEISSRAASPTSQLPTHPHTHTHGMHAAAVQALGRSLPL